MDEPQTSLSSNVLKLYLSEIKERKRNQESKKERKKDGRNRKERRKEGREKKGKKEVKEKRGKGQSPGLNFLNDIETKK